ncbi:hypothetical protein [Microbacterium oleivorans]|uniref:Uncharacterized protein n=1 Tax=Microbacterium oleivorans TaxID=273677 RepID=A0A7D5EWF6_9MICO|nr:hypothetical protein [Microbacterium oleivorans]QLD10870.1 hypothetical protein HW566_03180 [Microbacterium oleivorans]
MTEWILRGGPRDAHIVPELPKLEEGYYVDDGVQEELGSGDDNGHRIGTFVKY